MLERSGAFINEKGQLPHHFVADKPVFQALSGATQTGPNVFWILSCLNYVKHSGNMSEGKLALAPLPIGYAVFIAHIVLVPFTGCGINPARSPVLRNRQRRSRSPARGWRG